MGSSAEAEYAGFPGQPPAPSLAAAVGLPREVEYQGRVWTLAPSDHTGVVARYGRHLRERALDEVNQARQAGGAGFGEAAMAAYLELATAGAFEFGSKLYANSLASNSKQNAAALVWAMLLVHQPGTPRAVAEGLLQDKAEELDRLFAAEVDAPLPAAPGSPS